MQGQNPAGSQPVPVVPGVPGSAYPQGPAPGFTQWPAAPMAGFNPSGGFPAGAPTYPGTQPYYRTPGPAALNTPPLMPASPFGPAPGPLGPSPGGAPAGAGGVGGVSMSPVGQVAPPAGPGGPHPLMPMPNAPLPQGFPNPFSVQQLTPQGPAVAPPGQAAQQPGISTVTGPMGYLPGIGYFSPPGPGAQAPATPPQFPPQFSQQYPQQQPWQQGPATPPPWQAGPFPGAGAAPPPTAFPVLPGAMPPQAPPPAPQAAQGSPNPLWLQLAWQLVQAPQVKSALGDRFTDLLEGGERMRFLTAAAGCLAGQELQAAFKALTTGGLDQTRFIDLFAQQLHRLLEPAR